MAKMLYKVEYQIKGIGEWLSLSQDYDSFAQVAMVADALDNRGHKTRIIEY